MDYEYAVSAAGRVNLIGEHIDYCGGMVFPIALNLKNTVYIKKNGTNKINLKWTTTDFTVSLDLDNLSNYKDLKYGNYQAGCAYIWALAGHKLVGCDMLHDCTVPFGSGLSSSAAIEVSTLACFALLSGEQINKHEIALLAQRVEREYINVNCGIMDQYASACGKKDCALLLDCNKVMHTYVPFDLGAYELIICNTNKPHNLIDSKYNERRAEAEEALTIFQQVLNVHSLAQVKVIEFERYQYLLKEPILRRARHIIYEANRVYLAKEALEKGDIKALGALLNESHASLRDNYEVSSFELDTLVELANSLPYTLGSRMTGAGFGGSTIALVPKDKVQDFILYVGSRYEQIIGYKASFYECCASDGIIVKKL